MNCQERALTFSCRGEQLLGVLATPSEPPLAAGVGVLVVVGGPQYRAGAHRQFVSLSRCLARRGHATLRFDYRAMGDSSGAQRSFEHVDDDIDAAIGALQAAVPTVRRVVLWGLCDGASAALLYAERNDPRVAGLALLNPWVRSPTSLARVHVKHYYVSRLLERDFWLKLLRGKVAISALRSLIANLHLARHTAGTEVLGFQARMARAWSRQAGPTLLLLSERDYTAREFVDHCETDTAWREARRKHACTEVRLAGADHTCSTPGAREDAEVATANWLAQAFSS